jgi:indolepyruvate ferredoxin oxidoreductase beta subunit
MEPLECLRYATWLSPEGAVVTADEPLINIPDYPSIEEIKEKAGVYPRCRFVEASALAKEAGLPRAVNMVMVGAASPYLPVKAEALEGAIRDTFARKGDKVVEANVKAFHAGLE